MPEFTGFSNDAVKFFKALRKNNKREWFQPRKETFDLHIRTKMEELVSLMNHELGKFAPLHIAEPKKAIYRIYRDTRFASDKTPYKTHIAANFPRQGMEKHAAASYYFSVSDEEIEIAGGLYMPQPDGLLAVRTHIAENHERFAKIVRGKKVVEAISPLEGDALTRVPKGFDPEHPAAEWIRKKRWLHFKMLDGKELMTSPKLLSEVASRFKLMAPLIDFLNEPLIKAAKKATAAERMF